MSPDDYLFALMYQGRKGAEVIFLFKELQLVKETGEFTSSVSWFLFIFVMFLISPQITQIPQINDYFIDNKFKSSVLICVICGEI